jgi:hypothetical protein
VQRRSRGHKAQPWEVLKGLWSSSSSSDQQEEAEAEGFGEEEEFLTGNEFGD